MREDSGEIAERGKHHIGAHKSAECRIRAHVDAAHDGGEDATEANGSERVVMAVVDVREEVAERGRVVARQRPEDSARRYVAADAGDETWDESQEN